MSILDNPDQQLKGKCLISCPVLEFLLDGLWLLAVELLAYMGSFHLNYMCILYNNLSVF